MNTPRRTPWYQTLHGQIGVAMVAAVVLGWWGRTAGWAGDGSNVYAGLEIVGELFMRLLRMIIVPLVAASLVTGVSSIDVKRLGAMGGRTLAFYLSTTSLAVLVGLALVLLIAPGAGFPTPVCGADADCARNYACVEGGCVPTLEPTPLRDVLLGVIPINPFASLAATYDLLGVITFFLFLGIGIAVVGERAQPLRKLFDGLNEVMLWITERIMSLAPLGIFALLMRVVVDTGPEILGDLAAYAGTVTLGLLVHGGITLPLILLLVARVKPWRVLRAFSPALMTAMSTASSAATLPLTLECAERRAGVDREVGAFVLPLGATVNMDGTALYEAVAALFIAQAFGIDLSLGQQVTIFLTATLAAIGAAGVPSAGLVTMIIVLEAAGLPLEGIGMLVAVDRVLDMLRTTVNVWGDACGTVVIGAIEGRLDRDVLNGDGAAVASTPPDPA